MHDSVHFVASRERVQAQGKVPLELFRNAAITVATNIPGRQARLAHYSAAIPSYVVWIADLYRSLYILSA